MPKHCTDEACDRAGELLPDKDFEIVPPSGRGKAERLHSQCRRCRNRHRAAYAREAYDQNRQAAKDRVKAWRANKKKAASE